MISPSALVLVKNEAYWLPYVLKQTEGYFDSYVIYDVGSTDHTRDVIDWWVPRGQDLGADVFVRKLPHVDPQVQGAFRNSMIVEGKREVYFILDGDELYTPLAMAQIGRAAKELSRQHWDVNPRKRYGVIRRVEVSEDLHRQYNKRRGHHRLYTRDAIWTGTHPGEVAYYRQNEKSEVWFDDIVCWHMHNTLRSPKEEDATKRLKRKGQKSYHPGDTMGDLELLDELPMLREPIENFPVSPALAALQRKR